MRTAGLAWLALVLTLAAPCPAQEPPAATPSGAGTGHAATGPDHGIPTHDRSIHGYLLADRLEAWEEDDVIRQAWKLEGWLGTDTDRLWLRSEGTRSDERTDSADVELFHGRSLSAWWDLLAGVRHDVRPRSGRTFAALGIQGVTPFWVEGSLIAYVGEGGRTAARLDAHLDLHFTGRLILNWRIEADAYGRDDASRGIGSGLSHAKFGARLRYEILRRFAPYLGVVHERAFGRTANLRDATGGDAADTSVVIGIRTWF